MDLQFTQICTDIIELYIAQYSSNIYLILHLSCQSHLTNKHTKVINTNTLHNLSNVLKSIITMLVYDPHIVKQVLFTI